MPVSWCCVPMVPKYYYLLISPPAVFFAASMRSPESFLTLVLFSTCEDLASLQKKKKRCYVTITETIGIVPTSLKFAKEECIRGDWWSNSTTFWHWGHVLPQSLFSGRSTRCQNGLGRYLFSWSFSCPKFCSGTQQLSSHSGNVDCCWHLFFASSDLSEALWA